MVNKEVSYLLSEYEGELLIHEDDNNLLKVSYSRGVLSLFSKLEIFILDRTKFSIVDGKVTIDQEGLQESFEAFLFRNFIPLLELSLKCNDLSQETFEELRENIVDGLYSFVRLKDDGVEMIVVSAGNLKKKGVFYYPNQGEEEPIPLIELYEENVKIHKKNFGKVPQL